jgi:hypothetical protein
MISNIRSTAVLFVMCACLAPRICLADFQYIPEGSQQAAPVAPAPTAPLVPAESAPVPVHHHHTSVAAHKTLPEGVPLSPGGGTVINGFGKQVPLVMALREIVPASYQFAYGQNLGLGRMVDWQGGKAWHDVLLDVLTPMGLTAKESGKVIVIEKAS